MTPQSGGQAESSFISVDVSPGITDPNDPTNPATDHSFEFTIDARPAPNISTISMQVTTDLASGLAIFRYTDLTDIAFLPENTLPIFPAAAFHPTVVIEEPNAWIIQSNTVDDDDAFLFFFRDYSDQTLLGPSRSRWTFRGNFTEQEIVIEPADRAAAGSLAGEVVGEIVFTLTEIGSVGQASVFVYNVILKTPSQPADLDDNGIVNGIDLGILLSQWSTSGTADLDNNNIVNGIDLGILLNSWSR